MPSVYHYKALGRRRHAGRLLPIEHNRPYASVAEGERNDLGDEPSSGPGSVAPPAVRPRAHDVVAVHEDSGFRCLGHAVLRSPSCRRGCPETECRPLPCQGQGQGAMILGAWGRDTMAMRIPGSYCADGADCDSAGIRRSPRTGIYSRLFGPAYGARVSLRRAMPGQGFVEYVCTEACVQCVRQPPCQDIPARPAHDRGQVNEAPAAPGCTCSNALRNTVTARCNFAALEGATTERLHVHNGCDRSPDPFSRGLDFPVAEMGVTQRHAGRWSDRASVRRPAPGRHS